MANFIPDRTRPEKRNGAFRWNGMSTADAVLEMLRGQVVDIVLGTIFLSIGVTACAIAAIRWRRGVRILVWWGIFSGMYGLQTLDQTPAVLAVLPHALKSAAPYVSTAVMYLLLVSALFAWRELTVGKLRFLIQLEILVGLAIAVIGIGTFVLGGPDDKWMFYNNLLAVFAMLVLLIFVLVPKFSKSLVISNHRILTAATLIFALEVLYTNLSSVLHYRIAAIGGLVGLCRPPVFAGVRGFGDAVYERAPSAFNRDGTGDGPADTVFHSSGESSRA